MPHTLTFDHLIFYDSGKDGITLRVKLQSGQNALETEAKLDTGATFCIFASELGEGLGLTIENGTKVKISTAAGTFCAFEHEVILSIVDSQARLAFEDAVSVYFAEDISFSRNVLGRRGLLPKIQLALIDYDGKLYLSKYQDNS